MNTVHDVILDAISKKSFDAGQRAEGVPDSTRDNKLEAKIIRYVGGGEGSLLPTARGWR